MDNLEEMDRFLGKFNLPRLNLEETEIMNKPITNTKIETVIKISQKIKPQGQMASQGNSISNIWRSTNDCFYETLSKNCRGPTSRLML